MIIKSTFLFSSKNKVVSVDPVNAEMVSFPFMVGAGIVLGVAVIIRNRDVEPVILIIACALLTYQTMIQYRRFMIENREL